MDRLDRSVYEAIARSQTPLLDRSMRVLSRAADYSKLSLGASAVLAIAGGPEGRRAAIRGLASVAVTATVVNALIKPLARRARPDRAQALVPERSSRRHATLALVSARATPRRRSPSRPAQDRVLPWTGPPLGVLAALVGYSRIHTGVHYPVDVLVGALCGVSMAELTGLWLDQRM